MKQTTISNSPTIQVRWHAADAFALILAGQM